MTGGVSCSLARRKWSVLLQEQQSGTDEFRSDHLLAKEQEGGGGVKGEGRGGRRGTAPLLGDLTVEEDDVVEGPDSSTSILSLSSFGLAGAQAQSSS